MDYRLVAVSMDAQGLTPEALDKAAAESGARSVYVQPLQNPTGRIMGLERRLAIVEVARQRDLLLVEDDLYCAYASELGLPPLASLAPERVFYVNGLSKSLTPGLRVGYCVPPQGDDWLERCLGALRAIAFCSPGLGALIATQWIEDGTAGDILEAHRDELATRTRRAMEILGAATSRPLNRAATHLWLPMSELAAERAAARALRDGVQVTSPTAPLVPGAMEHGLRVCLGAAPSLAVLDEGLSILARALTERDDRALGMV
jgi:DNA-binding transcriptional MocR family regulator